MGLIDFDEDCPAADLEYRPATLTLFDSFLFHAILRSRCSKQKPHIVAVTHFLKLEKPEPHWQYWY